MTRKSRFKDPLEDLTDEAYYALENFCEDAYVKHEKEFIDILNDGMKNVNRFSLRNVFCDVTVYGYWQHISQEWKEHLLKIFGTNDNNVLMFGLKDKRIIYRKACECVIDLNT